MKKLMTIVGVFALTLAPVFAQTNSTDWVAPIQVIQTAATIKLNNISITVLPNGQVAVAVAWVWLDSSGRQIRQGVTRYTEAQIKDKLESKGSSLAAFKGLFMAIAAEEAITP